MLLSLALTVILVSLLSMVVRNYWRAADASRTHIEECQIARNVLQGIANDLKSAVLYAPLDDAMLSQVTGLAAGAGGSLEDLAALGEEAGADSPSSEASDATAAAQSLEPPPMPGLYGNQYEMSVDVARLPRVDQYETLLATEGPLTDRPSDVKTVAYYLRDGLLAESPDALAVDTGETAGLVRRSLDRAITTWASENGSLAELRESADLIAPEICAVEFRYFDGVEWLFEWDSDNRGGLPVAVEIAVAVLRDEMPTAMPSLFEPPAPEYENQLGIYRLVVHLPIAEPTEAGDGLESTEQTATETSE